MEGPAGKATLLLCAGQELQGSGYSSLLDQVSLGSSASRKPSPSMLKDRTVRKIANPGQTAIHGALVRKRCAVLSIEPQDGAGGCWPSPRKDRLASATM